MKFNIHRPLKDLKYILVAIGSAVIIFDINYYLMWKLPGSRDQMCVMGVNLNVENILFSVLLSVLTGVLLACLLAVLAKRYVQNKIATAGMTGLGAGIGLFTLFCPVCAIPVLSVGGFSVFFQLFNDYNWVFKFVALFVISAALFMVNKQLEDCEKCVFKPKNK